MANMSYCRFQNTVSDLDDCLEHINDNLSADEHEARQRLVELARQIVAEANSNDSISAPHDPEETED